MAKQLVIHGRVISGQVRIQTQLDLTGPLAHLVFIINLDRLQVPKNLRGEEQLGRMTWAPSLTPNLSPFFGFNVILSGLWEQTLLSCACHPKAGGWLWFGSTCWAPLGSVGLRGLSSTWLAWLSSFEPRLARMGTRRSQSGGQSQAVPSTHAAEMSVVPAVFHGPKQVQWPHPKLVRWGLDSALREENL